MSNYGCPHLELEPADADGVVPAVTAVLPDANIESLAELAFRTLASLMYSNEAQFTISRCASIVNSDKYVLKPPEILAASYLIFAKVC